MMTIAQRKLARHALGLPNSARRSYRNRYVCMEATREYANWAKMELRGYAMRLGLMSDKKSSELICFYLTRAGAQQALMDKEALCEEDFPPL